MDNSSLLRCPTTTSDATSTPTKRLLTPLRTPTASPFPSTPSPSTCTPIATKTMEIIKIFQTIIFDRENTIALLTASNDSANARITSLVNEKEELKGKLENMATQVKVLTQALQLQLEPSAVMIDRFPGERGRGTRRPFSFGGVGSAKLVGLSLDVGAIESALARVVESPVRVKSSSRLSPTSILDVNPVLVVPAMTTVGEPLEDGPGTAVRKGKKSIITDSKVPVVPKAKNLASKRNLWKIVRKMFFEYWW